MEISKKIKTLLQKTDLDKKKWKIINQKKYKKVLKPYIKMNKKIIRFDDTEIEKHKFHQHKSSFLIDNIDINNIVVSNKVSFGKKDFK